MDEVLIVSPTSMIHAQDDRCGHSAWLKTVACNMLCIPSRWEEHASRLSAQAHLWSTADGLAMHGLRQTS